MDRNRLLTDAERRRLVHIPEEQDELIRLYTLESTDLALIGERRDDANRLGFAVQLALLRHPGVTLAGWLQGGFAVLVELVSFLAEGLDLSASAFTDYAARAQTMTDHARDLAQTFGLRLAGRSDIPMMIDAAAEAARGTDRGLPIATGIITALRANHILLPALSTIERAGLAGRARARKAAMQALIAPLSETQSAAVDALIVREKALGMSRLSWLKTLPDAARPDHIGLLLGAWPSFGGSVCQRPRPAPCIPTGHGSSRAKRVFLGLSDRALYAAAPAGDAGRLSRRRRGPAH